MKSMSRRELISGFKSSIKRRNAEKVALANPLRPPRAIPEIEFLMTCDGCQKCVEACPYGSIFVLEIEDLSDGTPVMSPGERACHLCEDFPCVEACPTDALSMAQELLPFGHVTINETTCFPFRGPECGACGVCPLGIDAMQFKRNRPFVDVEQCVGCGLCIQACPTMPASIDFVERIVSTESEVF